MAVVVWLRIQAGEVVEAARDLVSDVEADMADEYRTGSVRDRVGQIDWAEAGKRAGAIAGKGMSGLGSMAKVGGPMIIMMVGEWFLDGALAMLRTEAGKPAADALARLGDVMLTVIAKVLRRMIPFLLRAIKAIYPVLTTMLLVGAELGGAAVTALVPVLQLTADVLLLIAELAMDLFRTIQAIARKLVTTWATIQRELRKIQRTIDGLVSGLVGAFATLLTFIIDSVLGPLREHLDNLSDLWDEWIGRHLPDVLGEGSIRHPLGYMWMDVWYEWGTGPLGEAPHDPGRVVEHLASEAQLVAALGEYSRANGGLARAMWGPV